ncbi:hypothetical protein EXN66_Car014305 [Channa argus]|uniref:Uncharacterized protein n=1 Tax=Channa argus TaxID=215402 RepID=A0A6G1Q8L9_CHAAH|nr:hypothetical protein EXN66_Car014305 [Channa argus]
MKRGHNFKIMTWTFGANRSKPRITHSIMFLIRVKICVLTFSTGHWTGVMFSSVSAVCPTGPPPEAFQLI